jgi:phosphatidylglycerol---prolipoprotein diacylglyceryl transferase
MKSIFIEIGPLILHWYGVMMALGFLAGVVNWTILGRSEGRSSSFCTDLMFWIMVSGIGGARLAYIAEHWSEYAAAPLSMLRLDQGGLIFYGGFIGAGVAICVFARVRKVRLAALFDFVITAVPLAHAFGRIGCFLNGCCYGSTTECGVGVVFPRASPAWYAQIGEGLLTQSHSTSLPVHPVQLYECAFNLALYGVLLWVYKRGTRSGRVLASYLMMYPIGRFLVEFLRGDKGERFGAGGLSVGQLVSVGLFAIGCMMMLWMVVSSRRATSAVPTDTE